VTSFDDRLRTLLDVASPTLDPDELANFLAEPHPLLGNRPPWDLITDYEQSEFEQVVEIVRGLASAGLNHASRVSKEFKSMESRKGMG
jgi:hypothetical protein